MVSEHFFTRSPQLLGFALRVIDLKIRIASKDSPISGIEYGNLVETPTLQYLEESKGIYHQQLVAMASSWRHATTFQRKSLATLNCHNVFWGGSRKVGLIMTVILPEIGQGQYYSPSLREGKIPAVMTASPYHQGTTTRRMRTLSMNVDLEVKEPHTIQVRRTSIRIGGSCRLN